MNIKTSSIWRISRAVANETRLQLLWKIFEEKKLSVEELAQHAGITEQNASIQLSLLAAQGLITPTRGKRKVFYFPKAEPGNETSRLVLCALRECHTGRMSFKAVIHQATAFTHERRIQLVRGLTPAAKSFDDLLQQTGMSTASLARHLNKLMRRGIVQQHAKKYSLMKPENEPARCLVHLAIQSL